MTPYNWTQERPQRGSALSALPSTFTYRLVNTQNADSISPDCHPLWGAVPIAAQPLLKRPRAMTDVRAISAEGSLAVTHMAAIPVHVQAHWRYSSLISQEM